MDIINNVIELVSDVLDMDKSEISEQTSQNSLEAWDSLATIQIINSIGEEYDIEIGMQDMDEFTSVGNIVEFLAKKVSG